MPEHDADRPVHWHDAAELRDRLHPPVHLPAAVLQHGELEAHMRHIFKVWQACPDHWETFFLS